MAELGCGGLSRRERYADAQEQILGEQRQGLPASVMSLNA